MAWDKASYGEKALAVWMVIFALGGILLTAGYGGLHRPAFAAFTSLFVYGAFSNSPFVDRKKGKAQSGSLLGGWEIVAFIVTLVYPLVGLLVVAICVYTLVQQRERKRRKEQGEQKVAAPAAPKRTITEQDKAHLPQINSWFRVHGLEGLYQRGHRVREEFPDGKRVLYYEAYRSLDDNKPSYPTDGSQDKQEPIWLPFTSRFIVVKS